MYIYGPWHRVLNSHRSKMGVTYLQSWKQCALPPSYHDNDFVATHGLLDLTELKFPGKLFVNESTCHENHQFAYKYHQLRSACKIHSAWFYNSTLHIKLVENGPIHKIFHPMGIPKVFGVDTLDEYTNNVSF